MLNPCDRCSCPVPMPLFRHYTEGECIEALLSEKKYFLDNSEYQEILIDASATEVAMFSMLVGKILDSYERIQKASKASIVRLNKMLEKEERELKKYMDSWEETHSADFKHLKNNANEILDRK